MSKLVRVVKAEYFLKTKPPLNSAHILYWSNAKRILQADDFLLSLLDLEELPESAGTGFTKAHVQHGF